MKSLGLGKRLAGEVRTVELVGSKDAVRWRRDAGGLHVELPIARLSEHAFALRVAAR